MRTRVKICGITRIEDALAAARAGADAIGLVFYPPSPRYVSVQRAREICHALPPFVSAVGLFVDAERAQITAVLDQVPLSGLQFHGDENAEACQGFGRPYLKAIAMRPGVDARAQLANYPDAAGFLFDAWQPATRGGGGLGFDWSLLPTACGAPLILAGGLSIDNVQAAVEQVRPYAVDVSSGVEAAKGIKSAEKIQAFMRGVKRGDANRTDG